MNTLTAFEKRVLEACVAGDHPVLLALRSQVTAASVASREHTGVGAYVDFSIPESIPPLDTRTIIIGDVNLSVRDVPAGVATMLYVVNGRLKFLEISTYEGDWPEEPELVSIGYLQEVDVGQDFFNLLPVSERHSDTINRALAGTSSQSAA